MVTAQQLYHNNAKAQRHSGTGQLVLKKKRLLYLQVETVVPDHLHLEDDTRFFSESFPAPSQVNINLRYFEIPDLSFSKTGLSFRKYPNPKQYCIS